MGYVSGDNGIRSVRDSSVRCFIIGESGICFSGQWCQMFLRDNSVRCSFIREWDMFQWDNGVRSVRDSSVRCFIIGESGICFRGQWCQICKGQ